MHVGLVNPDAGIFGAEVAKALSEIDELNVETFDVVAEAEEQVAKGEATAAIVIPAGFTQKIDAYTPTTIDVIVDPAQPESASIVTGMMNQVVAEVTIWGEVQYGIRTLLDESGVLQTASAQERRGHRGAEPGRDHDPPERDAPDPRHRRRQRGPGGEPGSKVAHEFLCLACSPASP